MADRNLVTYLEEQRLQDDTGWTGEWELTGYKIEIERSAAGQPGILITITNALDEPTTIFIKDALALFGPVLEWLFSDGEHGLVSSVSMRSPAPVAYTRAALATLVAVALERLAADTTDDGRPVQ